MPESPSPGRHGPREGVLARADQILRVLEDGRPRTLTEICGECALPRATIHRALQQMVWLRWAARVGDRYQVGTRMFELGTSGLRTHWFHRLAHPHLADLQRRTDTLVHLAYLDGVDIVFWEVLGGTRFAALPTRIGDRRRADSTALGRAILATAPAGSVSGVSHAGPMPAGRDVRADPVNRILAAVRTSGLAYDREETVPGYGCIAAAITAGRHVGGQVTIAAVSVCAPIRRIAVDPALPAEVRTAARDIARAAAEEQTDR